MTTSRPGPPSSGSGPSSGPLEPLLVESFVAGAEVAVEGLLVAGALQVLAVFDKPDPLDGPFFEETIYVTPVPPAGAGPGLAGRHGGGGGRRAGLAGRAGARRAARRRRGRPVVIEVAARSIGGLCSRALRFGAGVSLEEVIVRHAVGAGLDGLRREARASGVMMLPIRAAGVLERCPGRPRPWPSTGWSALRSASPPAEPVVPLPEGDRYLGFVFARGLTPADVELALRRAEAALDVVVRPGLNGAAQVGGQVRRAAT